MKTEKIHRRKRPFPAALVSLALILVWHVSANGARIRFGDNSTDDVSGTVEETILIERNGYENFNYGGRTANVVAGDPTNTNNTRRALIRIRDIGANIPAGQAIVSARLFLYSHTYDTATPRSVSAYRVLLDWVEGTANGTVETGSSCWNYARYTSLPWNTVGCDAASDTAAEDTTADRRSTPENSTVISTLDQYYSWDLTHAVRNWYSGDWSEYGVILINDSEGTSDTRKYFRPSENSTDGIRPYLEVVYEPESNAVKEFVCTIKNSGGDYSTLGSWESSVQSDLTSLTTKVFAWDAQGSAGLPPDGAAVHKASDPYVTATCVHATGIYSGQILLKNISGGTFEDNDVVQRTSNPNQSVTLADRGQSAIAVAECYNDLTENVTLTGWTTDSTNYAKISTPGGEELTLNGNLTISGPDQYVVLDCGADVTNLTVDDSATLKVLGGHTVTAANNVNVGTNGSSADTARIITGGGPAILEDHSNPPSWYDQNWKYCQGFSIDHTKVDEHLRDFPVLVRLDSLNSDVFGEALSNGDDILFTASDGATKLDHKIHRYIDVGGGEELIAHVKIPWVNPGEELIQEDYSAPPSWYSSSWAYCQTLTIDHTKIDEDLTDFPLLIKLQSDESVVFGKAQPDGDDILFTASDGVTKVNHELEKYVDTPGAGQLVAHVKVPIISSTSDTVVYMYFGNGSAVNQENPTGTWNANYTAVWHLSEDPAGTIYDSTSNDYDGSSVGAMTSDDQVDGKVDGALDLDGSDDYIDFPMAHALTTFTIESWINLDTHQAYGGIVEGYQDQWEFITSSTGNQLDFIQWRPGGGYNQYLSQATLPKNTWIHAAVVIDGTSGTFYIDGVEDSSFTMSAPVFTGTTSVILGASMSGSAQYLDGTMDEVRISDVVRSPAWLKASYHSQNNSLLV